MVDFENAIDEFMNYVKAYDTNIDRFQVKIGHCLRVMGNCKMLAKSIGLSEEEIDVAMLVGLLHDIGKLRQYSVIKQKRKDHGDFAVEILAQNNYIRHYIKEKEYDDVIFKAIKNHNKYKIEDGLSSKELLFSKIIRDSDELDIFYEMAEVFKIDKENYKNLIVTEDVLEKFEYKQDYLINKKETNNDLDQMVWIMSFIYCMNFKESFKKLKEEDLINRIIDKFEYNEETEIQMLKVKQIANDFVNTKLK